MTSIPNYVIEELIKIQKSFFWGKSKPKIKNDTLRNEYKDGGLKSVDIRLKSISLKCSWIKRLYNDSFHEWKLIPLYYFNKNLGKHFKFHSNLSFSKNFSAYFPCYYREILDRWSKFYTQTPTVPSTIASQFL